MDNLNIIPIGSGSTGNCFYIELDNHRFLIDMGIGCKKVKQALQVNGRDLKNVEAIFLTHGHYDHVKAATAICNNTDCVIYCDQSSLYPIREAKAEKKTIETDKWLEIFSDLKVKMFSVSHDYVKTCGFIFKTDNRKIVYLTDCGKVYKQMLEDMSKADLVILEANHDIEMLKNGPYPIQLQNRILSKYGHLSNEDCAKAIEYLYKTGTRNFLLAHLSLKNNTPELAYETVRNINNQEDLNIYVCKEYSTDILTF